MCKKCGKAIELAEIVRSSTCEFCGADLHSCVNCTFYSRGSHYDCHEPNAELVRDKERANFCDYFSVNRAIGGGAGSGASKAETARNAFAALFGS